MKTIQLSFILVVMLAIGNTKAQPILINHEKFAPNQEVAYYVLDTTNVNEGQGGENVTWDFSQLTATGQTYKKSYLPLSQTQQGGNFPSASLAMEGNDGATYFLSDRNDTVFIAGTWIKYSGILIKYQLPMILTIRPMKYNQSLLQSTRYTYKYSTYDYKCGGNYLITADGYGTLKLGSGTYTNVLRVKFDADFYDTLQGTGTVQRNRTTIYTWYNLYSMAPLVEMKTTTITSTQFNSHTRTIHILKNPSTFMQQTEEDNNTITAWVKGNTMCIKGLSTLANPTINLYDISGKKIALHTQSNHQNIVEMEIENNIHTGIYVLLIQNGNEVTTQKISIQQ